MNTQIQKLTATVLSDLSDVRRSLTLIEQHIAEMERKKDETTGEDFITSLLLLFNAGLSIYNTLENGKKLIAAVQNQQKPSTSLQAHQALPLPSIIKATATPKKRRPTIRRSSRRRLSGSVIN